MFVLFGLFSSLAFAEKPLLGGDVKQFFITGFPYEHLLMPDGAYSQAFADGRLKFKWDYNATFTVEAHHVVTLGSAPVSTRLQTELAALGQSVEGQGTALLSGVGLQAPEAIDLTWSARDDEPLSILGRTDRLNIKGSFGSMDVQLGRQPVLFGNGFIFNPRDLLLPFSASVIDGEYKPGVDALRADFYVGMNGQITALAAYMGDWTLEEMFFALDAKTTVGETDISGFLGEVHGDHVVGAGFSSNIGPVGITGDATVTFSEDSDPFYRVSTGVLARPGEDSTLNAEIYIQTNGAGSVDDYLDFASNDPRFQRGELWLMGRYYGALGLSHQIHPLISGTLSAVGNLADFSAMYSAAFSISAADSVQINFGLYYGIGERPDEIEFVDFIQNPEDLDIGSEFGLIPAMGYLQTRAYF